MKNSIKQLKFNLFETQNCFFSQETKKITIQQFVQSQQNKKRNFFSQISSSSQSFHIATSSARSSTIFTQMGTINCCQNAPTNVAAQHEVVSQDQDPKMLEGMDFINLLQENVQNHFFTDYNPVLGIQTYIGINVENLSSLYQFVKQIKDKDHQSSTGKACTDSRRNTVQNTINTECETIVDEVKTALFELKKNTKKNVKSLELNDTKNNDNFVDIPYYLPWIQTENRHVCVYIGQWKYEGRYLQKNFPNGVGRLYINNEVWQGQIQLSIQKLEDFTSSAVQKFQLALNQTQTTIRQKINLLKNNLTLELNGYSRKFTKDDEYCGHFQKGLLNGKGEYKNFKHDYSYEGAWIDNQKDGKGIEKTKLTNYEGEWKQNKKEGQGTLIFYISQQQQKQREKQQKIFDQINENHPQYKNRKARVTIEMALEEISDSQIRQVLKTNLTNYKGEQLFTFQHMVYSPWEVNGFPFVNKNFVQNIKYEQVVKTNFLQKYVGQFVADQFHGKGMYQWAKGNFYVGDWVQSKMEGLGKFYWKEGFVYYGQYKNDMKHGKGEMKWDPYKRHRGNWAFGKKHGYGEQIKIYMTQNQGLQVIITSGLWKNNNLDSQDIYWSKAFPLTSDPNYISYTGILVHNYFYYHPQSQVKLSQQNKFKVIMQSAANYFKRPCKYCGSYILKEERTERNGGILNEVIFSPRKFQEEEIKVIENASNQNGPQVCKDCRKKLKELEGQGNPSSNDKQIK